MDVNVVVLMGETFPIDDAPVGATVQRCLDRAAKAAGVTTLNGKVRINGSDVIDLDAPVEDGTNIIVQPEAGQVKNGTDVETPVSVSFVQVVEIKLIDNKTLTDKIKVGAVLRDYLDLPACGTEVTLDGNPVALSDFLQSGTYQVTRVQCGPETEEDEEEEEEDEDGDNR